MRFKKVTHLIYFLGFLSISLSSLADNTSEIKLPPLPYENNALEPYISSKTLDFHYGRHHQGYVTKLNELIKTTNLKGKPLEEIITQCHQNKDKKSIYNNAAQIWNHTFYWNSMKKEGGGQPHGELLEKIIKNFGSYEKFRNKFIDAGTKIFGSGWVWLIQDGDTLKIITTKDGDLPLTLGKTPLLTCDVWEHAYYLDYQNRRKDYVEVFLDHLANWDFAVQNMKK